MSGEVDPLQGQHRLSVWLPSIRAGSGADVFVERLAEALQRAGVDVEVTWFAHLYELAPFALAMQRPPPRVNIIHSNAACAFAFKRWGLPVVATEHHYVLDEAFRRGKTLFQRIYHSLWVGPWTHLSYDCCDALTAVSHFTADAIARHRAGVRAQVISHWLDYQVFSPIANSSSEQDALPVRLLFVGNLSKRKGGDVVKELAHRLGDGFEVSYTGGLRRTALERRTLRNLGRLSQKDLVEAYRGSDAVLVPSRYEGFGYSALEAMACGKPVIGFRCGAMSEVLGDVGKHLLVDIDDIDGLVACCHQIASDRECSRRIGRAGRARAINVYSEDRAVSAYIDTYKTVLRSIAN